MPGGAARIGRLQAATPSGPCVLRRLASGLVAALLMLGPAVRTARAALLDDYIDHGYVVVAQTTVVGVFTGCRRDRRLTLANGLRFTCAEDGTQAGYDPRAYILAQPGQRPSVLLIGSRPYAGALVQPGSHGSIPPVGISATNPPGAVDQAGQQGEARLRGIQAVQSINALQANAHKRLNDAQDDALPSLPTREPPRSR